MFLVFLYYVCRLGSLFCSVFGLFLIDLVRFRFDLIGSASVIVELIDWFCMTCEMFAGEMGAGSSPLLSRHSPGWSCSFSFVLCLFVSVKSFCSFV